MRVSLLCLLALPSLLLAQPATTSDKEKKRDTPDPAKGVEVKVADLDDFVVKGDKLLVNNFSLTESADGQPKGMAALKFAASCKNRSAEPQQFAVMVVGLDEKKGVVWAAKANGSVDGKGVGLVQDYTILPQGTLKGTAWVWVRVVMAGAETPGGVIDR